MAKKEKQTSNIWGGGIYEEGGKTGRGIYEDGEYADDLARGKGERKREMAAQREPIRRPNINGEIESWNTRNSLNLLEYPYEVDHFSAFQFLCAIKRGI